MLSYSDGKSHLLQEQYSKNSIQNPTSIKEATFVCIEKLEVEQKPTLVSPNKYRPRFIIILK